MAETSQRNRGGAWAGTEGGPPNAYRKAGEKLIRKVLFNFLCWNINFLKGHLEKKRKWFQELLYFASSYSETGLNGGSLM